VSKGTSIVFDDIYLEIWRVFHSYITIITLGEGTLYNLPFKMKRVSKKNAFEMTKPCS